MNALRWIPLCAVVLALVLTNGVDGKKKKPIKVKKVKTGGSLHTVSVGRSGVWGVSKKNVVYYREGTYGDPTNTGSNWKKIDDDGIKFKHVAVGHNTVWAVATNDKVYYREDIDSKYPTGDGWKKMSGSLAHVTVSPAGYVWGVNKEKVIYYRQEAGSCSPQGDDWKKVGGSMVQLSAGYSGVWGVNKKNQVYYMEDSFGDVPPTNNPDWMKVEGTMVYVSSGDGYVTAIDKKGQMYVRTGVTSKKPMGKNWKKVGSGNMEAVDSYSRTVWAVSDKDEVSKTDLPQF